MIKMAVILFGILAFSSTSKESFEKDYIGEIIRILVRHTSKVKAGRCFHVWATAYSNDEQSINIPEWRDGYTSEMLRADRGSVAVDPAVIPMGSVLWIEGYGYSVAMDRGSAIRGDRVDLFFNSRDEAIHWGVRKVLVCILGVINLKRLQASPYPPSPKPLRGPLPRPSQGGD